MKVRTISLLLLLSVLPMLSLFAVVPVQACGPPPGTGTPGYWKNHPEAWPVCELDICGQTWTKEAIIAQMNLPVQGNKWNTLFNAYVAAYLNVAIGNPAGCIDLGAALQWLCDNAGSPVAARSSAWQCGGECLYLTLDAYNNGELCAPPRE